MSGHRLTLKMASAEGRLRIVLDIFNWRGYSGLQKWFIVAAVALSLSWLSSLWTLTFLFVISSAGGFKLSEQILKHDRASHYAEQIFYRLESMYLEIKVYVRKLERCIVGSYDFQDSVISSTQIINELSPAYEIERDKQTKQTEYTRMSSALQMEINSIQLLIIRDFIRSWYADFSYDSQFLKESKYFLQQAFNRLILQISKQNPKFLITRIIQFYHYHFTMYQRAKSSFESHKVHPKTKVPQDSQLKRHPSIDAAFGAATSFHPALDSEAAELNYLRGVIGITVLAACRADVVKGQCVRAVLISILTNKMLLPVMKMMSNPDWLMEVIIVLTSDKDLKAYIDESYVISNQKNDETGEELEVGTGNLCTSQISTEADFNTSEYQECVNDTDENQRKANILLNSDGNDWKHRESDSKIDQCEHINNLVSPVDSSLSENINNIHIKNHDKMCSENLPTQAHLPAIEKCKLSSSSSDSLTDFTSDSAFDTACHSTELLFQPNSLAQPLDQKNNKFMRCNEHPTIYSYSESANFENSSLTKDATLHSTTSYAVEMGVDSEEFESDPQFILSNGKRLSSASVDSHLSYNTGDCVDGKMQSSGESDANSEAMSSSFSKLSTIRNFLVDSLKPSGKHYGVKKPKSLALFSEKLSSNLKSKKNVKSDGKSDSDQSQKLPQLLLDGTPLDINSAKSTESPLSSTTTSPNYQATPVYSESEMTPSPGLFSGLNLGSFFSPSSPHHDLQTISPVSECEICEDSPSPASSPSSQTDVNFCTVALAPDTKDVLKLLVPDDRRIFQDISIPNTSIHYEHRSSTKFSLYEVQYEALYFSEEGKSIIRSGTVRRRYREFTNLQSRLEGHQAYKKYLKNIKGPKRWPTLPFKSVDKDTVETRRLFLEKYLKDLTEIEAICNGPDLREFLAYEGDSHIAFVKKSPDITVPRFDKMLIRGVSEVVDRIKALPNIPQEVMLGLRGREGSEEKQNQSQSQLDVDMIDASTTFQTREVSETSNLLYESCLCVLQDLDTDEDKELFCDVISDPKNVEQESEAYRQEVEKVLVSLPRFQRDGAESPDDATSARSDDLDLSFAVLDLLAQSLQNQDHWICRDRVIRSMQLVLGKALNRYLETSINSLITDAQLTSYLRLLRETIWPQGQLGTESSPQKTDDQRAATREHAKRCLINFFPNSVRWAVGQKEFEEIIGEFLSSIESEQLNRHLLYTILDLLMEQLFPEVTGHEFLADLLFSRSSSGKSL